MDNIENIEINLETNIDQFSENFSELLQIEKTSAKLSATADYFNFELNCDEQSYMLWAKDKGTLPSLITIPRNHNGMPVTVIKENGFSYCGQLSILIFEQPSNIKKIASSAFLKCINIESIELPKSVENVESCAFSWCTLLQQVYFCSNLSPRLGNNVFYETSPFLNLYVPACSVRNYKNKIDWQKYRNTILPWPNHIPSNLSFFTFELKDDGESYAIFAKNGIEMPLYLAIPCYYNQKPVTVIGPNAFRFCKIVELVISDTVEEIESGAFLFSTTRSSPDYIYSESVLQRIIFGNKSKLKRIGNSAFHGNLKLSEIKIPEKVTVIEANAFFSCGFSHVYIPENVETMGSNVFYMCLHLKHITVGKDNKYYRDIDGVVYDQEVTALIAYPLGKEDYSYRLPLTVNNLITQSFWGCKNLRVLFLDSAYPPQMNVQFVNTLPSFKIYVPDESYEDYKNAPGWDSYNDIIYKKSIIKNGFAIVEDILIQYVENASEIMIPKEIAQIKDFALISCNGLEKITVEGGNTNFIAEDGVLFNNYITKLISYPTAKKAKEYQVPKTVKTLGFASFFDCKSISAVCVHKQLESIEDYAFFRCSCLNKLINLDGEDNIKTIGIAAFLECVSLEEVYFISVNVVYNAFSLCYNLKKITYGPDLKYMGGIFMSADTTRVQINLNIFALIPPIITNLLIYASIESIKVPAESIELYKTILPWSYFSDIIYPLTISLIK